MSTLTANLAVLVVDDHPIVAHGLGLLLKDHVRCVESVESGEALLVHLHVSSPDIVLLDIGMRGISGLQALESLRLLGFTVPVVILSIHVEMAIVRRALELGASGYVVKQASEQELVAAIESAARGEVFISPGIPG